MVKTPLISWPDCLTAGLRICPLFRRRAVATVNRVLNALLLEKHPDKTLIGRTERGFSFLGYFLTPQGISVARSAVKQRIARLYEQGAGMTDIGRYVVRWLRWAKAGLITILGLSDALI